MKKNYILNAAERIEQTFRVLFPSRSYGMATAADRVVVKTSALPTFAPDDLATLKQASGCSLNVIESKVGKGKQRTEIVILTFKIL